MKKKKKRDFEDGKKLGEKNIYLYIYNNNNIIGGRVLKW